MMYRTAPMHDLGKVVTAAQLPELHKQITDNVEAKQLSYYQSEKDILGFGHDRINAWRGFPRC